MARPHWILAAAAVCVWALYFYGLTQVGLLGPDEPRYASIGRAMAESGDWVTPKLWGDPWFEKPALLYWMIAAAYKLRLGDDLAPRAPVALCSVAFLVFYFVRLRREFGERAAFYATCVLGSSAGWVAFSMLGVTDLPMSAAFAAAMLLCLPWLRSSGRRGVFVAGLLLGLAVLAKGFVPLALTAPLLWVARRRWQELWALALGCALVAAPWYALCTMRNGWAFIDEFFVRHHFSRFSTSELQHVQPWWFYVPVLLASVYPWCPLVAVIFDRRVLADARQWLLALWVAFGFVFFSLSQNKLPGYVLPLLPALAALIGIRLDNMRKARSWLMASAVLLGAVPVIAQILPAAIVSGIGGVKVTPQLLMWGIPVVALGCACAWSETRFGRSLAIGAFTALVCGCVLLLKLALFPELDRMASVRGLSRALRLQQDQVCVEDIRRMWRYGLNFYLRGPLPNCEAPGKPLKLRQLDEGIPIIQ